MQCVVVMVIKLQDGLTLSFIQTNWEVIREDFFKFMIEFHKDNTIVKVVNHTFIALILKSA